MLGETDLTRILATLDPILHEGTYVYCTVPNDSEIKLTEAVLIFREDEAKTVILEKKRADELALDYHYEASWITLSVNSSLDAVGLTAKFSSALGEAGISCNVVAGFYHDHIFVGKADANRAVQVLTGLKNS